MIPPKLAALKDAVLGTHADQALRPEERAAIFARAVVPEKLRAYLQKVALQAYKVTDEELAALKAEHSEEQLFEATIAAALGAAWVRLEAGLKAMERK
jgi:hypothetical protein